MLYLVKITPKKINVFLPPPPAIYSKCLLQITHLLHIQINQSLCEKMVGWCLGQNIGIDDHGIKSINSQLSRSK